MLEELGDSTTSLIAGYPFLPEQRGERLSWADVQTLMVGAEGQFR